MLEVIRWISLALMWAALGINVWSFIRCERVRKELKNSCAIMENLIKEWEEKHL
jgi:hypothetical protein